MDLNKWAEKCRSGLKENPVDSFKYVYPDYLKEEVEKHFSKDYIERHIVYSTKLPT